MGRVAVARARELRLNRRGESATNEAVTMSEPTFELTILMPCLNESPEWIAAMREIAAPSLTP